MTPCGGGSCMTPGGGGGGGYASLRCGYASLVLSPRCYCVYALTSHLALKNFQNSPDRRQNTCCFYERWRTNEMHYQIYLIYYFIKFKATNQIFNIQYLFQISIVWCHFKMNRQDNKMAKSYECQQCGAKFSKLSLLEQHRRLLGHHDFIECVVCRKKFARRKNLETHIQRHQDPSQHSCESCGRVFSTENILSRHKAENHQQVGAGALKRSNDSAPHEPELKKQRLTRRDNPEEFYDIQKVKDTNMEKIKTKATYFKVSFKNLEIEDMSEILKTLRTLFQSIIDNLTMSMEPSDLVRLSIDNQELDFPISLPFMRRSALTVDRLLSEIERVLQSYEQFVLDESLGIEMIHVRLPGGGVSKRKPYVDLERLLKDKTAVIRIQNTDELCLARALVVVVARIKKDPQWNNIRQGRNIQKTMVMNLHHRAGVPLGKCGIAEIK